MGARFRNFVYREVFHFFLATAMIMLGVIVTGILFDAWFKDPANILLGSLALYLVLFFIRLFFRSSRKT
jgi:hypothetical protein